MNLFILSCVFDPADKVLGLKVPLFCLAWLIFIIYTRNLATLTLPRDLVFYVFAMIFLPLISICYYYISNGAQPYEGFSLFKAHILISFAILLYLSKINIISSFCTILTVLAIVIILIYGIVLIYPISFIPLHTFGNDNEIFYIGERIYNEELKLWSIFFPTSPMLAIPIAYYVNLAIVSSQKRVSIILATINILGMFLAGTRNNMFTAFFLPVVLIILRSRNKVLTTMILFCIVTTFILYLSESILIMLDPAEKSNAIKLGLLNDYANIFSNPIDLLFGQGLGSYSYWPSRNNSFYYITEYTYLEIVRNFGIILGGFLIILMLYPILAAFYLQRSYNERHLIIAYLFYLIMSATNPLFFSSLGMLILSVIIANIFMERNRKSILKTC